MDRLSQMRRIVFAAVVVGALVPTAALAHGDLRATDPEDGARVKKPPKEITVSLTEAPTDGAVARATDGCKKRVPSAVSGDGDAIVLTVEGGEPGKWKVAYRAVSSVDGHQTKGRFDFTVAGSKDCSPDPAETDDIDTDESPGTLANPEPSDEGGSPTWLWWVIGGTVVLGAVAFVVRKAS